MGITVSIGKRKFVDMVTWDENGKIPSLIKLVNSVHFFLLLNWTITLFLLIRIWTIFYTQIIELSLYWYVNEGIDFKAFFLIIWYYNQQGYRVLVSN